jgi:hypothetical protein
MNGCAMLSLVRFEHAAMGMEPLESGQQGWMDIEHAAFESGYESRAQNPHESRQHDQIGRVSRDRLGKACVERRPVGKTSRVDVQRINAGCPRTLEPARVALVARDGDDLIRRFSVWCRIDQSLKVRTRAGDQHDDT